MVWVIVILRVVHIFAGIFWAGVAFMNAGVLQPALKRMGSEGGPFAQNLMQRSNLAQYIGWSALLATAAGVILWIIDSGFSVTWMTHGVGLGFTLGGLAGVLAFFHGYFGAGKTSARMGALGAEIRAAGGQPTPEQVQEMRRLGARLQTDSLVSAMLLALTVLGMSLARYIPY